MEFHGPFNESGLFNGNVDRWARVVLVGGQVQVVEANPPPNQDPLVSQDGGEEDSFGGSAASGCGGQFGGGQGVVQAPQGDHTVSVGDETVDSTSEAVQGEHLSNFILKLLKNCANSIFRYFGEFKF